MAHRSSIKDFIIEPKRQGRVMIHTQITQNKMVEFLSHRDRLTREAKQGFLESDSNSYHMINAIYRFLAPLAVFRIMLAFSHPTYRFLPLS